MKNAVDIINSELDIPVHKIIYLMETGNLILAAYHKLTNYGIKLTDELAELFIRMLEIKIVGNDSVEHEWSEKQWIQIEKIRSLHLIS